MTPDTAAHTGWHQVNIGEDGADDWCYDLPRGCTIEIGPAAGDYSIVYVIRDDELQVREEISFPHQPDRAAAMAAVEAIPVCATCGLPIHTTTERGTGWDHIEWDDEPHDVQPKVMDALGEALLEVERAKYGDSNDGEIDALNCALDEALLLLGRSRPTLSDEERLAIEEGE